MESGIPLTNPECKFHTDWNPVYGIRNPTKESRSQVAHCLESSIWNPESHERIQNPSCTLIGIQCMESGIPRTNSESKFHTHWNPVYGIWNPTNESRIQVAHSLESSIWNPESHERLQNPNSTLTGIQYMESGIPRTNPESKFHTDWNPVYEIRNPTNESIIQVPH